MRDLTRGPIPRLLLTMAAPIAVGLFVQTMHYLVDLYFVSRLGGVALAGVSAAGNLMFLVLALTQTLSVGTVALVSHAVGRKDRAEANLVFNQAVLLAGALGTLTLLGGYLGPGEGYISAIGADAATVAAGTTYLRWFVPGLAAQFALAAMSAALQGTGIVKPTMVVQMLTVVANLFLTPVLVAGWLTGHPLGVVGAGLSSTIAASVGVALMAFYFFKLERYVGFHPEQWRPRFDVLRRMLGIGIPAGGEFGLMFVFMGVIYAVIGGFGAEAQAGFGVGMRVMQAVFLPAMSIAFALPAIAGQNFGARNADRVRASFRVAVSMSVSIMIVITLVCQWRPEWLVAGFSSDPVVLAVATGFMGTVSWNFVATGLIFCCSGMFQATGNTWPALASTATRLLTFVLPVFWLAQQPGFKIEHVWYLSMATVWLQMALSLSLLRWQLGRRLRFPEPAAATQ